MSSPKVKAIKSVLQQINYRAFIEQAYLKGQEDTCICWITNSEGDTNSLISAMPQNSCPKAWILLYLSGMQGGSSGFVQWLYKKMCAVSDFTRVHVEALGEGSDLRLFVKCTQAIPNFDYKFIDAVKQCGSVIIRSTDKTILLERLSLNQNQSWQDEAKWLLNATTLLKGLI